MFKSLPDRIDHVLLEENPLEKVDRYTYLGHLTTMASNKESGTKNII